MMGQTDAVNRKWRHPQIDKKTSEVLGPREKGHSLVYFAKETVFNKCVVERKVWLSQDSHFFPEIKSRETLSLKARETNVSHKKYRPFSKGVLL